MENKFCPVQLPSHIEREMQQEQRRERMLPKLIMKKTHVRQRTVVMWCPDGDALGTISLKKANWCALDRYHNHPTQVSASWKGFHSLQYIAKEESMPELRIQRPLIHATLHCAVLLPDVTTAPLQDALVARRGDSVPKLPFRCGPKIATTQNRTRTVRATPRS